jgi:glycosyltransferase involved in cell wall biosynthesis
MPGISAIIITFNEEKNLARCLESLSGVADEIIVVDSFSTDRTTEICKKYNVRFNQNRFEGYIQQKNYAVSLTTFPVVLSLDGDEALSQTLQESIINIKNNWDCDGYYTNRINNYCGRWIKYTSWYPDRKLRLWDKTKGSWEGLNPHDRVELEKGSKTGVLCGNIEHYSYDSVSEHITQVDNFASIAAQSYYDKGIRAGYRHIIFNPLWKFFREMVLKRGFLQGFYGLVISGILSFGTFLKYVKLKQLDRKS